MAQTNKDRTEYMKAYRLANKDKRAAYLLENKEKIVEQTRKNSSIWSKNNPEKRLANHKSYLFGLKPHKVHYLNNSTYMDSRNYPQGLH